MRRATTPYSGPIAVSAGDAVTIWEPGPHGFRTDQLLPLTLGGALSLAAHYGCREVWLHASSLEVRGLPRVLPRGPQRQHASPHGAWLAGLEGWNTSAPGLAPHAYYWQPGGAGVDLNVPAWAPADSGSPFAGLEPGELAREVYRFRTACHGLAVWKGSATITSDALLRRMLPGLEPSAMPPPVLAGRGGELAYSWRARPDTGAAGAAPAGSQVGHGWNSHTCYAFDLNLAYLNGASSLALGCGEMVPAVWDDAPRPGWWRVDPPGWNTDRLPAPWSEQGFRRRGADGPVWVTLPTAKLAAELGAHIGEGWVFPDSHRYLDGWYKCLRNARAATLEGGGAAYSAIKQVAQHGLGRMGSARRARGDADPLYQPYWREAVIAEMRTRLLRRILRLRRYPVAIDVDCCYFLSNARTPESFAEWAGLPLGTGLGQFKCSGSLRATDARAILAGGAVTALTNLRGALAA